MIRVILGEKGTGKTKTLLGLVDDAVESEKGSVVFINSGTRHIYDLNYRVRLIDTSEFEIADFNVFYGMICGAIAQDFDMAFLFIDSLTKIVKGRPDAELDEFLTKLHRLCDKLGIKVTITISIDPPEATDVMRKFIA